MRIEVISERCHIADKSYEKYNIFVQIDAWSRGVVWDITLGNIINFQNAAHQTVLGKGRQVPLLESRNGKRLLNDNFQQTNSIHFDSLSDKQVSQTCSAYLKMT